MTDRVPGAPGQYQGHIKTEEFAKLQKGEPFAITMKRDDQPITEGTPYSKAAMLPDALAQVLCPEAEDPTPADALEALYVALGKKAPHGYGLGLEMPNQINDCNNAKETGFYRYTAGAANAPSASGEWLETISYSSTYKYQRAFVSYTGGNIAERWMKGGVWQPWGWVNPPMEAGVEYRTTEWHNGKAVYTKRINFGAMPNNTQRSSPIIDEAVDVVSLQGIAYTNTEVNQFPVVFSTGLVAYAYTQKSSDSVSAFVRTFTDMSLYTAQFTVKYTK